MVCIWENTTERQGNSRKGESPAPACKNVERRHSILRHAMHVAEEQLIDEGIRVTFKQLLAHCTFAGNALISYGGATPYNARFGRQPALLPDLHRFPDNDNSRCAQRIREVAVQRTVEQTAIERIHRGQKSVTTASGQELDYKPGELLDFFRPPGSKDRSGWQYGANVM